MARKDVDERLPEPPTADVFNPFVGGEDDDLSDMEYMQDETSEAVDTHPPATKEEAEQRASGKKDELVDPTPPEEEEPAAAEDEAADTEAAAQDDVEDVADADDGDEVEVPKIPKDRFDEVNERMKKAERELAEMREKLQQREEKAHAEPEPEPYDYATKEQEAADALLEGDTEKYSRLQSEIRAALREETLREAKQLAQNSAQETRETLTFEETAAKLENQYPQFNIESDSYDEAMRTEMLELYVGYARSGSYSRAEALEKAAAQTARIYRLNEPAPAAEDDSKVVNIRKTDVKKKVAAQKSQPPIMDSESGGRDEPRVDINNMSDEEFESLPESKLRQLRGDVL